MITNIVVSVVITLVTNVVQTDNAEYEQSRIFAWPEGGVPSVRVKEATERYTTTNVTEHTEITVPLPDGPRTFTVDKAISSVTSILKKLEEWKPAGVRTNDIAPPPSNESSAVWTNIQILNGVIKLLQ